MAETPSLALFNLTGMFSAVCSLIDSKKIVVEPQGFEKVPVRKPWFGRREPLEAWVCPLSLSEETEPRLLAQFCGYDHSYCDKPFGILRVDRGKIIKGYDEDADSVYEKMNLRLFGPALVRGDRVLPRRSSVDIEVESYEGAGHYIVTRRDSSGLFGLNADDFSRLLPNEQLIYSEVLKTSKNRGS